MPVHRSPWSTVCDGLIACRCLSDGSDAFERVQVVNGSHVAQRDAGPRRAEEVLTSAVVCRRVVADEVMITMTRDVVGDHVAAAERRRHGARWLGVTSKRRWLDTGLLETNDAWRWTVGLRTTIVPRCQCFPPRTCVQSVRDEPARCSTVTWCRQRTHWVDLILRRRRHGRRRRRDGRLHTSVSRYVQLNG